MKRRQADELRRIGDPQYTAELLRSQLAARLQSLCQRITDLARRAAPTTGCVVRVPVPQRQAGSGRTPAATQGAPICPRLSPLWPICTKHMAPIPVTSVNSGATRLSAGIPSSAATPNARSNNAPHSPHFRPSTKTHRIGSRDIFPGAAPLKQFNFGTVLIAINIVW